MISVYHRVKNIVGKGENASFQNFSFPTMSSKDFFSETFKLKELADHNLKFDKNGSKFFQKGKKHCTKRRNCSF